MKISEAVKILQRYLEEKGDADVYVGGYDESDVRDTRLDRLATDIEDWYDGYDDSRWDQQGVTIS